MILTLLSLEAVAAGVMLLRERRATLARKLGKIKSDSKAVRWVSRRLGIDSAQATALEHHLASVATKAIRRLAQHEALDSFMLSALQFLRGKRKGGIR